MGRFPALMINSFDQELDLIVCFLNIMPFIAVLQRLWFSQRRSITVKTPGTVWDNINSTIRLRLHGTGPEPFRTEPDWIGFCLHGIVLEPVRNGSKIEPAKTRSSFGSVYKTVPCEQKAYPQVWKLNFDSTRLWASDFKGTLSSRFC